jgi:late competence protein required for DNA uptake (superfamily II DNA/RNA helicase)
MTQQCDRCGNFERAEELTDVNGRRLCRSCFYRLEQNRDDIREAALDSEHDDDMGDDGRWDGDFDD